MAMVQHLFVAACNRTVRLGWYSPNVFCTFYERFFDKSALSQERSGLFELAIINHSTSTLNMITILA